MSVRLHHDSVGPADGSVLVLSGAVGSTIEMWKPNLDSLAEQVRVVRLDHRGHGGSATPSRPYAIADLAGDALATLDSLEIKQFAWCGLSMGAAIGMEIATTRPDRVTSLTLCGTSARFNSPLLWRDRADRTAQGGTRAIAMEIVERWFTPEWAQAHPAEVATAQQWVSSTSDEGYRGCCEAIANWNHREHLSEIQAPTLLIFGNRDTATPVDPDAVALKKGIPNATLKIIGGAHLATMESPGVANSLIRQHLIRYGGA